MTQTHTTSESVMLATAPSNGAAAGRARTFPGESAWWIGFAVLLAAGWYNTFAEMWLRWFPAWRTPGYTFSQRLSEGDSYYAHGPLVPMVSLMIAWAIHRRIGAPISKGLSSVFVGWILLIASLALHLLSVYARVTFVSGFGFIGVLAAMALLTGGWARLKAYALPIAFLVFMVPLPMNWIADLNFALKSLAGRGALACAVHLFGIPAVQDGSFIHLSGNQTLIVENVCGGLRSLISLACFASLFALVCRVRGMWRWVMLLLSAPLAVACNMVRITALIVVAHHHGVEQAGPGSWFHDLSGFLVFALALGVMFAIERLIMFAGTRLNKTWTDPRLLGYLESIKSSARPHGARGFVLIGMPLVLAAALSVVWGSQNTEVNSTDLARNAAPVTFDLQGATFTSHDMTLDRRTLAILETNDYLYRRYVNDETRCDLAIIFSANNRKGTHPPEVCLEGGGEQITDKRITPVDVPGVGMVSFRELHTQQTDRQTLYLYVYKCGDAYTPDFLTQQARIFVNSITARNTAGALIRFSAPVIGSDIEQTRRLLTDVAATLMVDVERSLP